MLCVSVDVLHVLDVLLVPARGHIVLATLCHHQLPQHSEHQAVQQHGVEGEQQPRRLVACYKSHLRKSVNN